MFAHMESLIWQVSFKVYICGLKLFSKQYFSRVNTLNYLVLNAKVILFVQHSLVIRQESFSNHWLFGAAKEKQWICVKKRTASKWFFTVFALKVQFGQLMICEDCNLLIRCVETSCNIDRKRFARVWRKQWSIPHFNIAISQWWKFLLDNQNFASRYYYHKGGKKGIFVWFRKPTWRRRENAG